METVAEVLLNRPSKKLNRTFTYRIPPELSYLGIGWRCAVPFRNHTEEGVILSVRSIEMDSLSYKLLNVMAPIDPYPWYTKEMLQLAWRISSYYMCTMTDALRLFLIDKKGIRTAREYQLEWHRIEKKSVLATEIDHSVTILSEMDALKLFGREQLQQLVKEKKLTPLDRPEAVRRIPLEKWLEIFPYPPEGNWKRQKKQADLWTYLKENGSRPVSQLKKDGFSSSLLRTFCANGWGKTYFKYKETYSLIKKEESIPFRRLTAEQEQAVKQLYEAVKAKSYQGILLKGVTGSGKTEVYLRTAEYVLSQGGMVLILVPEIALTDQMVSYFAKRFGDEVVFVHSKLSKGERYNNRMRLQRGESHIVIGSRSALFMPFQDLRLIAVDEEYDSSYKQEETPRYNGRDTAKMLAVIHQCPIVLGAATPSVVTYFAAEQKQIALISMDRRIDDTPLPKVSIVDMRDEFETGNGGIFSRPLIKLMKKTIEKGQKVILFLNRRGYSTSLQCRSCGYVFKCPRCDVALVYHKERQQLKCHYCESVFPLPSSCPSCGNTNILYRGRGTEKIEEELKIECPDFIVKRLDLDSVSRKNSSSKILADFRAGAFPILLGTQMVAKGHSIPGVQTVGILAADQTLNLPSYLAAEQAFNLITQCAGRAGRYGEQGEVILQTYNPDHYVIRSAAKQDYLSFYEKEIQFRQALGYPPFSKMMKIICFSTVYEKAAGQAERIRVWLEQVCQALPVPIHSSPPYDEPIKKVRNIYYIAILIKGKNLSNLKTAMRSADIFQENGIIIDVDPIS